MKDKYPDIHCLVNICYSFQLFHASLFNRPQEEGNHLLSAGNICAYLKFKPELRAWYSTKPAQFSLGRGKFHPYTFG